MKTIRIAATGALLFICCIYSAAQNSREKKVLYKSWISLSGDGTELKEGMFLAAEDSSLTISDGFLKNTESLNNIPTQTFDYKEMNYIRLRKKGNGGAYAVLGALAGLTVGVIIGFAEGDDQTCNSFLFSCTPTTAGEKAANNGFFGAMIGGAAGAVFGSIKIKIPINGDLNMYRANKSRLEKYAFYH